MVSSKRAPASCARQQFSCEQYPNSMPPRCARAVSLFFFPIAPLPLSFWSSFALALPKKIFFSNKKKMPLVGAWRSFLYALSIFFSRCCAGAAPEAVCACAARDCRPRGGRREACTDTIDQ
nr:hypothetical protein [Pandoravirus belohorizontensis]